MPTSVRKDFPVFDCDGHVVEPLMTVEERIEDYAPAILPR